jgi:hypothetical protein
VVVVFGVWIFAEGCGVDGVGFTFFGFFEARIFPAL